MKRGPKPTTGRFDTREELIDRIFGMYTSSTQSVAQVARCCGISEATASKILAGPRPPEYRNMGSQMVRDKDRRIIIRNIKEGNES